MIRTSAQLAWTSATLYIGRQGHRGLDFFPDEDETAARAPHGEQCLSAASSANSRVTRLLDPKSGAAANHRRAQKNPTSSRPCESRNRRPGFVVLGTGASDRSASVSSIVSPDRTKIDLIFSLPWRLRHIRSLLTIRGMLLTLRMLHASIIV